MTVTIRVKGARQFRERTMAVPGASSLVLIGQCDRRQILWLNREQKTYTYVPIHTGPPARRATALAVTSSHAAAGREEITIDTVDTGERRQFGTLAARHIITTTTRTIPGELPPRATTRVQDGWYVDLPPFGCVEPEEGSLSVSLVSGGIGGVVPPPPHVTVRGRAKAGIALIETDRTSGPEGTWNQATELVEISTAPLDAALFDVPADYRAALPFWSGGFDLSRPDTVGNRLSLLWEGMREFAARWWP